MFFVLSEVCFAAHKYNGDALAEVVDFVRPLAKRETERLHFAGSNEGLGF